MEESEVDEMMAWLGAGVPPTTTLSLMSVLHRVGTSAKVETRARARESSLTQPSWCRRRSWCDWS